MKRITFAEGFQQIVDSGLTREEALEALNKERTRGLRVWCNDRAMEESEVRDDLRFRFNPNDKRGPPVVFPAGPIGWAGTYTFELDAVQIEALIAKIAKRGAPRNRKPGARKGWALDILRKRIKAGDGDPPGTLFRLWRKRFWDDKTRRDTLQRRFLRWFREVENEPTKKSDK